MDIQKELYDSLKTLGYEVYPEVAPQNKPKPFIIYNETFNEVISGINCVSDVQNIRFQIDIYSNSYEERRIMINSVKNELLNNNMKIIVYNIINTNVNGDYYKSTFDIKIWSND